MNWPVVILAGGLATRLGPITEKVPKLLVEVGGKPFFEYQIDLLKKNGLTKIVLCVGYLGEMIVERYGDGSEWGIKIDYSFDGPKLLGTGGALVQALPKLDEAFYVLYGDSYLPVDYRAIGNEFSSSQKKGLMTVYRNEGRYDTSNVSFQDGTLLVYDKKNLQPKMNYIDYGLSVFRKAAFEKYSPGEQLDLADVQKNLVEQGEMAGYEVKQRFYEIGSFTGLQELEEKFLL